MLGLPTRYMGQQTVNPAAEGAIVADEIRLIKNVELMNLMHEATIAGVDPSEEYQSEVTNRDREALRFAARRDKDRDYIGLEVHAPGVGRLLNALAEDGSDHVRVYHHDAVEVLQHEVADGSLDEVRIYFPDPWHKKRHNKRRLVQPEFAALVARKLRPGGRLHCATDWEAYAEHMWDVLDATPGLVNRAGPRGSVPRPDWRPQTHFETRGQKLGHGVWDLVYDKTGMGTGE